ncbi:MAG: 50S ribosomal protein L23 [Patescibacteria group bacterium]
MALFAKKSEKDEAKTSGGTQTALVSKEEASSEKKAEAPAVMRHSSRTYPVADHVILKKPILSEKTFRLSREASAYVFEVDRSANKLDIKKAFFNIYGIMPRSVNVLRGGGERTRRGKIKGHLRVWKRAVITVPKGKQLESF